MTEPVRRLNVTHAGRTVDPLSGVMPVDRPVEPPAGRSPGAGRRSLVQFHRPLLRAERARLQRDLGLALTDYRPELAYVESLGDDVLARLADEPLVRAVVPFDPGFRRPPGGGRRAARTTARGRSARTLEAVLFDDADPQVALQALRERGAADALLIDDRRHGGARRIRFTAGDGEADEISGVDDVRWLDEVGEARPDSTLSPAEGDTLARAWVRPLWDLGLTGEGQVIGLMDSPVDLGHTFFADPVNPVGPRHRKIAGYRDEQAAPPARHGTFVAGIAAGDDPARPGADPGRGVAWAARLTYGNYDDLARQGVLTYLAAAADDGARVHTNSWHDEPEIQYDQLAADLDAFSWIHEEHLVIGSAANHREAIGPPGTAKNTLAVAASHGGDPDRFGDGAPGPTADGRLKPEVMAPGCSIRSAVSGTVRDVELDQVAFGQPRPICASSWATPAVAGLAALARQYYTEGRHPTGTARPQDAIVPSGALLRATLLAGCRAGGRTGPYPSITTGWGPVRLDEVLTGPGLLVHDVAHADGPATGESVTLPVDVADGSRPLAVTLVWTDPPGAAGATAPMVNHLHLTVTSPDGAEVYAGNDFTAGFSRPAPSPVPPAATEPVPPATTVPAPPPATTVPGPPEPVQRVVVREPAPGRWTVTVAALAVNVGRPGQGFAVVVLTTPAGPSGPTPEGDSDE
jgi:Subtilase family